MKNFLFVSAFFIVIMSSAKCKEDETVIPTTSAIGTVDMNIKAKFNDQPLELTKIFEYKNGKKVRFTKLSFFMSGFRNSTETTAEAPLLIVDFKDIDDNSKALKGINLNLNKISAGNKSQFDIGIGVASNLNLKKPKDYPSTHPLSEPSNYWDAWNSYIFFKLEGSLDKDGDGKFETGITLHAGGNEVYQNLNFSKAFTIKENETTPLSMELDISKLINGIDLETYNSTHQIGDLPTMKKMMDNFQTALIIK